MSRRALCLLLAVVALFGACGDREERTNVRPPLPGAPSAPGEVQGIYRTIHQGTLQLRSSGDFVMIIPEGPGPSSGSYTLEDGDFTVTTSNCESPGLYRLVVTGVPEPDEAMLEFTVIDDPCRDRAYYLTIDPWVYSVS